MKIELISKPKAITFDLFGTVLDLGGSLKPYIQNFLDNYNSDISTEIFWQQLRYRQRIEQYQDSLIDIGHSGYLETAKKAFIYISKLNNIEPSDNDIKSFMDGWNYLSPFPECRNAMIKLSEKYNLVALSNGDLYFLEHLVKNRIKFDFHKIISVDEVGYFKPKPGVYRKAASNLNMEPNEIIMVSANSFDVMGARTCGFRGVYVNRYNLPYEETIKKYKPDIIVSDFNELVEVLS